MKQRFIGLALALGISAAACATDPCSRTSPCPNDTPPTQAERDQCRATLTAQSNSACYGEVIAYVNCRLDNTVCGGDGMTDSALTDTRAQNNCANQRADALACCTRNPSATACQ